MCWRLYSQHRIQKRTQWSWSVVCVIVADRIESAMHFGYERTPRCRLAIPSEPHPGLLTTAAWADITLTTVDNSISSAGTTHTGSSTGAMQVWRFDNGCSLLESQGPLNGPFSMTAVSTQAPNISIKSRHLFNSIGLLTHDRRVFRYNRRHPYICTVSSFHGTIQRSEHTESGIPMEEDGKMVKWKMIFLGT